MNVRVDLGSALRLRGRGLDTRLEGDLHLHRPRRPACRQRRRARGAGHLRRLQPAAQDRARRSPSAAAGQPAPGHPRRAPQPRRAGRVAITGTTRQPGSACTPAPTCRTTPSCPGFRPAGARPRNRAAATPRCCRRPRWRSSPARATARRRSLRGSTRWTPSRCAPDGRRQRAQHRGHRRQTQLSQRLVHRLRAQPEPDLGQLVADLPPGAARHRAPADRRRQLDRRDLDLALAVAAPVAGGYAAPAALRARLLRGGRRRRGPARGAPGRAPGRFRCGPGAASGLRRHQRTQPSKATAGARRVHCMSGAARRHAISPKHSWPM